MFTKVIIAEDGDLVADSQALAYATKNIGKTVTIGTDVMLTAFRVLRARGDIDDLEVVFIRGSITDHVKVDKHGSLVFWPQDEPIINANEKMLIELIGWKTGKNS